LSHGKILGIEDSITHSDGFATEKACFRPLPVLSFNGVIDPKEAADEASKGVVLGAENSWDVFPKSDCWRSSMTLPHFVDVVKQMNVDQRKVAAFVIKALP
jgi:hypothetical protein